jgi:hypothetical protein
MKECKVSGYRDIAEVYVDGIHFNNVGDYVVGATFYSTIFRDDPRGLTAECPQPSPRDSTSHPGYASRAADHDDPG